MQRLLVLLFLLASVAANAQVDTAYLNKLSPDELLKYYINEKEPQGLYKGPEKVGDSLFNYLNPLVVPTKTVEADALFRWGNDPLLNESANLPDSVDDPLYKLKPKISLGVGRLGYHGNIYEKAFQSPLTARYAFDLNISMRLARYLQLNFNAMFGKLGANENLATRHANFQSEIRAGGLNLLYDFGNFIPDKCTVRPFISAGITGFEFLSKTDIKDKNGNTYYYWTDGSIRNMPQNAPDAQHAVMLKRDYSYETDVRTMNEKINGKYAESTWAIPVGIGFILKATNRIDVKFGFQYYFTNTTYIDGITSQTAIGPLKKNNFSYTSLAIQYDLITVNKKKVKLSKEQQTDAFWLALDKEDLDKDGVEDLKDKCPGTEKDVKVDANGCPLDDDGDGIPNYRDDELSTPPGSIVNEHGVAIGDDHWQKWYDAYMNDSTGIDKTIEVVGGPESMVKNNQTLGLEKDVYTVQLARYTGSIPSDEMAYLLSIGDIKSTTLDDGTTVIYTAGDYKKVSTAAKRRDEFRKEGNNKVVVAKIKGKNINPLNDDEVAALVEKEKNILFTNTNIKSDSITVKNNNANNINPTTNIPNNNSVAANTEDQLENYSKDDIIYRVQLGAFKNKISTSVFNTNAGVLELKTGDNIYRYVTKGFKTIEQAAAVRADLVIQGYSDAFVAAYKDGKRILLTQTKATVVDKKFKEDLNENKIFSSVSKDLVKFRIQIGLLKKPGTEKLMEVRTKVIDGIEKQITQTGSIRFVAGKFNKYDEAQKYLKEIITKGFDDAFIIATFKDDVISTQEALELLK
ncbi:MAG: SPOR domain-containing protein [Bacteroidetes bacterium]|nr:SPOR domain-containing protein [Bacteroidota bacterium]